MTAADVRTPEAAEDGPGLLYRLQHPREAWHLWREDARAAHQALVKPEHKLLTGENVRFRWEQMLIWGIAAGFVGACVIAGLYFGLFEVYWHMPDAWFGVRGGGTLKGWWDNLFPGSVWPAFRHAAFRDIPEPALALMAVQTLLAKDKYKPVSTRRVIISPLVVVFATFALGALSVLLVDFAFPNLWHLVAERAGDPGYKLPYTAWLGRWSLGIIIPGIIISRLLRVYWAPVGATLQGGLLDRSIDRKQSIVQACGVDPMTAVEFDSKGWHIIPWAVRLPLTPPVWRERFAKMWRSNAAVSVRTARGRLIALVLAVAFVLFVIGFIGHYLIGSAHLAVPYFSATAPR